MFRCGMAHTQGHQGFMSLRVRDFPGFDITAMDVHYGGFGPKSGDLG